MNALARFSASVALALLLGFPTFAAGLRGEATLARASVRFLVLFAFARIVVHTCATLVERYATPILEAEAAAAAAEREARAAEAAAREAAVAEAAAGSDPELLDPVGVDGAAPAAA